MSRRTAGVGLIAIAALIYSARLIATAIITAQFTNVNPQVFGAYLGYTDQGVSLPTLIAVLAGIGYLVWAELAERRKK
jgi:hypothetical protein